MVMLEKVAVDLVTSYSAVCLIYFGELFRALCFAFLWCAYFRIQQALADLFLVDLVLPAGLILTLVRPHQQSSIRPLITIRVRQQPFLWIIFQQDLLNSGPVYSKIEITVVFQMALQEISVDFQIIEAFVHLIIRISQIEPIIPLFLNLGKHIVAHRGIIWNFIMVQARFINHFIIRPEFI